MKHLLALAVLLLSLNVNAARVFIIESGSYSSGPTRFTPYAECPTNSYCSHGWAAADYVTYYDRYTDTYDSYHLASSIGQYDEYRFIQKQADLTINWWYKDADTSRSSLTLSSDSGSVSYGTIYDGFRFEFGFYITPLTPFAEMQYQLVFSNLVYYPEPEPPVVTPPVVQPVPVPPALALMLPLFAGFTLRKLSV
jgi:hypothetical protein